MWEEATIEIIRKEKQWKEKEKRWGEMLDLLKNIVTDLDAGMVMGEGCGYHMDLKEELKKLKGE